MRYYKNDSEATACRFCGSARYKKRYASTKKTRKQVPVNTIHYLPIIPRLKWLYTLTSSAPT
ncbi:hypothetical protein CDL15_Pgr000165 [Punica granatum]|uniref:Uncharacterized protein n=1 Tax=Punica granatum TaxID=22663 RepID=A0A218Y310_PUNGR|nr:hypothetical protein CDL15_Pgr000165 [Punica granatum]